MITLSERPLYLQPLNTYCFRFGKENPRIVGFVNFTPEGYEERPCFKVVYESDNLIDYIPYADLGNEVWKLLD